MGDGQRQHRPRDGHIEQPPFLIQRALDRTAPLLPIVQAFLALVPELAAALGLTSATLNLPKPPMTVEAARAILSQPH